VAQLFNPLDIANLLPGMLISNIGTGELWKIIRVDELSILIISISKNAVSCLPINDIKAENWLVCVPE
jgi:hypothetical protein